MDSIHPNHANKSGSRVTGGKFLKCFSDHVLTSGKTEISSVHWVPLSLLTPPFSPSRWSHVEIDVSTRLSPRNKFVRWCLRNLIGKMK